MFFCCNKIIDNFIIFVVYLAIYVWHSTSKTLKIIKIGQQKRPPVKGRSLKSLFTAVSALRIERQFKEPGAYFLRVILRGRYGAITVAGNENFDVY